MRTTSRINWARRSFAGVALLALFALLPGQASAQAKKKAGAAKKEAKMAPAAMAAAGPVITRVEPRGVQRGVEARIRLTGTKLDGVTNVVFANPKISGEVVATGTTNEVVVNLKSAGDLPRGSYDLSVRGAHGESGKVKLHIDDFPQVYETMNGAGKQKIENLPVSFWGTIDKPGRMDHYEFNAKAGQLVVFELAAESLGSKATDAIMTLVDSTGAVVASNNGFDGSSDALIAFKFPASGVYSIRVSDLALAASKDNFYRLSVGAVPYVTGIFPISARSGSDVDVELLGYNLPADARVKIKAAAMGEADVPVDANKFHVRRPFKVMVTEGVELTESEPNDTPQQATPISVPSSVNGRIWARAQGQAVDVDLYRFEARAGQELIIETLAARRNSPVDTKVEVLHPDGRPVERLLLQAVRDSYITFRSVDSNSPDPRVKNWEEMELNQYLYMQGEVCKIFRMPQGPDSGFKLYNVGAKRLCYFDTSGVAHALDEPCYIVQPQPVGAKLVPNGLPVFPVNYVNDDDAERKLGTDSRLHFVAPQDGAYLVRVTDNRGFGGDRYAYRLTVREAKPDFKVSLVGANPTVDAGAGVGFSVKADRTDGFDDEITVEITGLPKGYYATTPLVIEAGHLEAGGSLFANADAAKLTADDWAKVKITATASVKGKAATQTVNNFGTVKLTDPPKLYLSLETKDVPLPAAAVQSQPEKPLEIVIAPGQTIPAWLRVVRNGDTNLVALDVDNLPHGVIVANIGLNGVQVRAGETERQIFLEAAKWVEETDRLCHVVSQSARAGGVGTGKQTSYPVLLKVRKPHTAASNNVK